MGGGGEGVGGWHCKQTHLGCKHSVRADVRQDTMGAAAVAEGGGIIRLDLLIRANKI